MEEYDDQRRFFGDLAATAEQSIEQIRGVEENYYAAIHWTILPFPWIKGLSDTWQSYVEQHFATGFAYALELSQAKDFQELALINTRFLQTSVEALLAQAKDFAEIYAPPVMAEKSPVPWSAK